MSFLKELLSRLDRDAIGLIALALGLIAVVHLGFRWWVRRAGSHAAGDAAAPGHAGPRRWIPRALRETAPPVILLIWVHGLAAIVRVLMANVAAGPTQAIAVAALGWTYRIAVVAGLVWLLARVGRLVDAVFSSAAQRTRATWDDLLLPIAGKALRRGLPLLGLILARPALALSPALADMLANATSVLLVLLVASVLYQAIDTAADLLLRQHRLDVSDNLEARAVYTQVTVLRKIALTTLGIFTLASMLMVFEPVRHFGASILASAGIAGIVVGFAAQRSIATLLAGFQIALTQPFRVDDVVIVENEWGRIEEITLTYVVVRIWDLRRLVVPITHFLEQPFQNWTRSSADLLATVFLYVDYTMPIEALRAELTRILRASPRWDGKVDVLQVTEARERTLEVRALASAADASTAWDLRCEVREQLVGFVQRHHPQALPRVRAAVDAPFPERMPATP